MARRIVSFNWMSLFTAIAILAICSDLYAQRRPFQIGRIFSAGGGQGVRIGGPRLGMQFGGGQGAIFGNSQYGMQFGGGRGAHFGGPNYGMQFGGGQVAQIGRLNNANPNNVYPTAQTPYVQPSVNGQPTYAPQNFSTQPNAYATQVYGQSTAQPMIADAPSNTQSVVNPAQPTLALSRSTPTPADQNPTETAQNQTETNNIPRATSELIRVYFPDSATDALNYSLNGSRFTVAPGHSFALQGQQTWIISFAPATSATEKRYTLDQPGEFIFKNTDAGWDLVQIVRSATETAVSPDPKQEIPDSELPDDTEIESDNDAPEAGPENEDQSD